MLAYLLYPKFLGDDTFIHIGFIKDLAAGKGFSFAGTKTYGSTSPLWVILGAILTKLFFTPETAVRVLSSFFSFTTIYLLYIALANNKIERKITFVAIVSLAFNSFFLRWALSGMEVSAAMSLLLLIYILFDEQKSKFNWYSGGLIFGLAILIRPEFLGFLFIFIVYSFFAFPDRRKDLFISALISFVFISGWLLFSYFYFGTIIPNTYLAKAGGSLFGLTFEHTVRTLKLFAAGNLPEIILVVLLLFAVIYYRKSNARNSKFITEYFAAIRKGRLLLPFLWVSGFYPFYILKDVTVISRYSLILVPFVILISATLFDRIRFYFSARIKLLVLSVYLSAAIVGYGLITFKVVKPASNEFVKGFQTTYKEMALIIKKDSGNRKTTVALTDVGIIGCYSGAKVYDFAGLVDDSRFKFKSSYDYVKTKKPDYIILRGGFKPDEIIPRKTNRIILFTKKIGGFGINDSLPRTVKLYKLFWK